MSITRQEDLPESHLVLMQDALVWITAPYYRRTQDDPFIFISGEMGALNGDEAEGPRENWAVGSRPLGRLHDWRLLQ